MTNEELILERLDRIEAQIAPLAESVKGVYELRDDLRPLAHNAIRLMIKELEDVESSFQLEDLLELMKRFLRGTRSFSYVLTQLENVIDFVTTLEPLLKSSVPQLINYLDDLEQRGVFRILNATLGVRAKIAASYTPEDIEEIGDGLVALLGLAKKITDPKILAFMERLVEIPANLDLAACKKIGPVGLLWASGNKEVKEGLGVIMELTKEMGKLKSENRPVRRPSGEGHPPA
jgi:uncharacterized protein YjgD (DUF1641 family)